MLCLGKVMRLFVVVGMMLVPSAHAADTAPAKAMAELTTNVAKDAAPGADPYACPVGATPSAKPASQGAAINAKAMASMRRVSKKNLPAGNYRERCFACLTMPDEDGERQLSCVCPAKVGIERITVSLQNYVEGQEISYCYGALVRGACMLTENASVDKAKSSNNSTDAATNNFLNMIAREKGK